MAAIINDNEQLYTKDYGKITTSLLRASYSSSVYNYYSHVDIINNDLNLLKEDCYVINITTDRNGEYYNVYCITNFGFAVILYQGYNGNGSISYNKNTLEQHECQLKNEYILPNIMIDYIKTLRGGDGSFTSQVLRNINKLSEYFYNQSIKIKKLVLNDKKLTNENKKLNEELQAKEYIISDELETKIKKLTNENKKLNEELLITCKNNQELQNEIDEIKQVKEIEENEIDKLIKENEILNSK